MNVERMIEWILEMNIERNDKGVQHPGSFNK